MTGVWEDKKYEFQKPGAIVLPPPVARITYLYNGSS